jgi:hypothetical protein
MQDKVLTRFERLFQLLLLAAIVIGLSNQLVRPNPNTSEWLSLVSIACSIGALFIYGITYGMRLRR